MSAPYSRHWLALAARHRLWQVEERLPELAECAAEQQRTEEARRAADDRLTQVRRERATLLTSDFAAPALAQHVDFDAHVQGLAAEAGEAAARAREEADRVWSAARTLLAERDACVERLERLQARQRQGAARRDTRALDELWLASSSRIPTDPEADAS